MYLLTFIVLLVSVLGLYANVAALQASKMAEQQKSIGETILVWHQATYRFAFDRMARYPVATNPGYINFGQNRPEGCLLNTSSGMTGEPAPCNDGKPAALIDDNVTNNPVLPTLATNRSYFLSNYNVDAYKFNTIIFQPLGDQNRYIITFVPPPAANDVINPVNFPPVGFSTSEIQRQLRRANVSASVRGVVIGTCRPPLTAPCFSADSNLQYPLPTSAAITEGSVGLYSILGRNP